MNTEDRESAESYERASTWVVGDRVRLTRLVERYPHFSVADGATGTVTSTDDECFAVKMDEHVPGAEAWDNEVCWYPVNGDDPYDGTLVWAGDPS